MDTLKQGGEQVRCLSSVLVYLSECRQSERLTHIATALPQLVSSEPLENKPSLSPSREECGLATLSHLALVWDA